MSKHERILLIEEMIRAAWKIRHRNRACAWELLKRCEIQRDLIAMS